MMGLFLLSTSEREKIASSGLEVLAQDAGVGKAQATVYEFCIAS